MSGPASWFLAIRRHFADRAKRKRSRAQCIARGCVEGPGYRCVFCGATGARIVVPARRW